MKSLPRKPTAEKLAHNELNQIRDAVTAALCELGFLLLLIGITALGGFIQTVLG